MVNPTLFLIFPLKKKIDDDIPCSGG
jgi:hypothetical protein